MTRLLEGHEIATLDAPLAQWRRAARAPETAHVRPMKAGLFGMSGSSGILRQTATATQQLLAIIATQPS
jgi:hypothetical protein